MQRRDRETTEGAGMGLGNISREKKKVVKTLRETNLFNRKFFGKGERAKNESRKENKTRETTCNGDFEAVLHVVWPCAPAEGHRQTDVTENMSH